MSTKLIWITPDAEQHIGYIARVSNPKAQSDWPFERLLRYMIEHGHWSPFEMASACLEITTTRDVARQILRHRSFSFQEFSQRYEDVGLLPAAKPRQARIADVSNRQSSHEIEDADLHGWWHEAQERLRSDAYGIYEDALQRGVAKEVARAVLPEGLTPSRLYMAGTIRSWMHYCHVRMAPETQKEHRDIAGGVAAVLSAALPTIWPVAVPGEQP